jgi:hypothetical protein
MVQKEFGLGRNAWLKQSGKNEENHGKPNHDTDAEKQTVKKQQNKKSSSSHDKKRKSEEKSSKDKTKVNNKSTTTNNNENENGKTEVISQEKNNYKTSKDPNQKENGSDLIKQKTTDQGDTTEKFLTSERTYKSIRNTSDILKGNNIVETKSNGQTIDKKKVKKLEQNQQFKKKVLQNHNNSEILSWIKSRVVRNTYGKHQQKLQLLHKQTREADIKLNGKKNKK